MLKFAPPNAKLKKNRLKPWTFSLPAGWTCPGANECLSRVHTRPEGLRIVDGPKCRFRCFAASQEAQYQNVYDARQHNWGLLRECKSIVDMADLILRSLPKQAKAIRVHVSGDFFNERYFRAWIQAARARPGVLFYAYTKSLAYWAKHRHIVPTNFVLTASVGGKADELIQLHGLRSARVVYSEAEARELGLEIDKDDSLAMGHGPSFALLIHGTQPAGSYAAKMKQKHGKGYR